MKKNIFTAMAIVGAVLLLQSCEKVDGSADEIRFSAVLTKAQLVESISDLQKDGFAVWCAYSRNGKFTDAEMLKSRTSVKYETGAWRYDNPLNWEQVGAYKFNALRPSGYPYVTDGQNLVLIYNDTLPGCGTDLMLAYASREMNGQESHGDVNLDFRHMLSAVRFIFDIDGLPQGYKFKIHDIKISDACIEGTLDYTDGKGKWNLKENPKDSIFYAVSEKSGDWHMVIPQELAGEKATGTAVNFTLALGSDEIGWTEFVCARSLARSVTDKWEAGKRYTYNILFKTSDDISVEVRCSNWDDINGETPEIIF